MDKQSSPFVWEDVWVLRSVIGSLGMWGRGATLETIVRTGDMINHAIFNYEELNDGLSRLMEGGYVQEARRRFRVSPDVRRHFRSLSNLPDPLKDKRVLEFLIANRRHSQFNPTEIVPNCIIKPEDFEAAVKKYLG
ncbi:MAG TPA: hypothetical protein VFC90_10290 [Planctomycetota bacterium]|nr:hypothetical protein [Planctomycetota bacterium]